MLKRKIEGILQQWKAVEGHNPLIIKGCRQCGKTYSVLEFAKKNYTNIIYMNFFQNAAYSAIFADSLEVDHIIMMTSAFMGEESRF